MVDVNVIGVRREEQRGFAVISDTYLAKVIVEKNGLSDIVSDHVS